MSQSGMATGVSGLSRLADAQSRTISPENPAGAKGGAARAADGVAAAAARDLGQGWKVNPYVYVRAGETLGSPKRTQTGEGSAAGSRRTKAPLFMANRLPSGCCRQTGTTETAARTAGVMWAMQHALLVATGERTVVSAMKNNIDQMYYPQSAAMAVLLIAVVLGMVAVILRVVDVRAELAK